MVRTARAGEVVKEGWAREAPATKVAPKCCSESCGFWVCITHGQSFGSPFDKDAHIGESGRHVMAWYCRQHGEVSEP